MIIVGICEFFLVENVDFQPSIDEQKQQEFYCPQATNVATFPHFEMMFLTIFFGKQVNHKSRW